MIWDAMRRHSNEVSESRGMSLQKCQILYILNSTMYFKLKKKHRFKEMQLFLFNNEWLQLLFITAHQFHDIEFNWSAHFEAAVEVRGDNQI